MPLAVLILRLVLGTVFLMSAAAKLAAPRQFVADVKEYRLLPRPLASAFGYVLPYAELSAAIMLMGGFYINVAALAVAVMLVVFLIAVGAAMIRKLNLTCSCFGLLYRERVGWPTQIRDGILLAMALVVLAADSGELSLSRMVAEPGRVSHALGLIFTALALGAGCAAAVLSIRLTRRPRAQVHP